MVAFQDLFSTKDYAKNLAVTGQVLSLCVNTTAPSHVVLSNLAGADTYDIHGNSPVVPPENKVRLLLYQDKLMHLAKRYRDQTGIDLFTGSDVDPENSAQFALFHNYCFVSARVRLAVGRDPVITAVEPATGSSSFEDFWSQFRTFRDRIALNKPLLLKMVEPCLRVDQYDFLVAAVPMDSTSYSSQESSAVKIEPEVKSEASDSQSYAFFSAVLEPQSQSGSLVVSLDTDSSKVDSGHEKPVSASNNVHSSSQFSDRQPLEPELYFRPSQEFLTQVPQTMDPNSQVSHHSPVLFTQDSQLDFDSSRISMTIQDSPGRKVPLAYLNHQNPTDNTFKVQAKIVGSVPSDLALVCTKSYMEIHGEVELSDPKIRSFEILLSDSSEKTLTSNNSLCVQIPAARVLSFFGYKHTEQLYTRMEVLKQDFSKVLFKDMEFDVSRKGSGARWTLDSSLKGLQEKLK